MLWGLEDLSDALVVSVMIVALVSVHWGHGLFAASNGIEVPLLYAAGAAALAFTGSGRYSLDALLGLTSMWTTANAGVALGVAALGAIVNLAARRSAVASTVEAHSAARVPRSPEGMTIRRTDTLRGRFVRSALQIS